MLKLYKFYWDWGRMGGLSGLFVADPKVVESCIGKTVQFGEILGKHSDVYGELEEDDLTVISDDQEKILWLMGVISEGEFSTVSLSELQYFSISGYNPLEAIDDWGDDDEDDNEDGSSE